MRAQNVLLTHFSSRYPSHVLSASFETPMRVMRAATRTVRGASLTRTYILLTRNRQPPRYCLVLTRASTLLLPLHAPSLTALRLIPWRSQVTIRSLLGIWEQSLPGNPRWQAERRLYHRILCSTTVNKWLMTTLEATVRSVTTL